MSANWTSPTPDRLEQRCVRPGKWVIEGWTVERQGRRRWRATASGHRIVRETLAEIRAEIADEIEQRQSDPDPFR